MRHALTVDALVAGDELTLALADELELLAPHGLGNRKVTLLLHGAEVVSPRRTRDRKHLQYRVRCDGASCQAIHFNFDALDVPGAEGRFDIPLSLSKNEYNGSVSAQVEVKALCPLEPAQDDLCGTACALACRTGCAGPRSGRNCCATRRASSTTRRRRPSRRPAATAACATAAAAPPCRR